MPELKVIASDTRYAGTVFNLIVDTVEYPSGTRSVREVADHPGGAVAIPILPDGRLLLIRQFRYPIDRRIYEAPAGKLNPGEDPLVCAQRELAEETGYAAERWEHLTSIYTTPGFCNEVLHLFLARDLYPTEQGMQLEEGELGLTTEPVAMAHALDMIDRGEIEDSKTICGILIAHRRVTR